MTRARVRIGVIVGALAMAALPGVDPSGIVAAQSSDRQQPLQPPTPPPGQSGDGAGFLEYALAIILAGAVIGVCFLPSKRGHKD